MRCRAIVTTGVMTVAISLAATGPGATDIPAVPGHPPSAALAELWTDPHTGERGPSPRSLDPGRGCVGVRRQRFIIGVKNGPVRFAFNGRHQDPLKQITPDDVKWVSERLLRLSDRQWHDAFRAGGYGEATTARYIARIEAKAGEGIALQ